MHADSRNPARGVLLLPSCLDDHATRRENVNPRPSAPPLYPPAPADTRPPTRRHPRRGRARSRVEIARRCLKPAFFRFSTDCAWCWGPPLLPPCCAIRWCIRMRLCMLCAACHVHWAWALGCVFYDYPPVPDFRRRPSNAASTTTLQHTQQNHLEEGVIYAYVWGVVCEAAGSFVPGSLPKGSGMRAGLIPYEY